MAQTPIPAWMQVEVLERDNWTCLACSTPVRRYPDGNVRPDTASIDHIVPDNATHRGMTVVDNLQTLCASCNSRKGNRIVDYRAARRPPDMQGLRDAEEWNSRGVRNVEVVVGDDWPGGHWVGLKASGLRTVLVAGPYTSNEDADSKADSVFETLKNASSQSVEVQLHFLPELVGDALRADIVVTPPEPPQSARRRPWWR